MKKFDTSKSLTRTTHVWIWVSIKRGNWGLVGKWYFRRGILMLHWWLSVIGCPREDVKPEYTWIRLLGLPLHLWSKKVYRAIDDFCGDFIKLSNAPNNVISGRIEFVWNISGRIKFVWNGGTTTFMLVWNWKLGWYKVESTPYVCLGCRRCQGDWKIRELGIW